MEGSYFDGDLPDMTTSMYQSAFSPESLNDFHTTSESIGESMYHSMVEEDESVLKSAKLSGSLSKKKPVIARNWLGSDPELAQERQRRRLLVASEKILSARLSIDEVLLSLSSRGKKHFFSLDFQGRKGEGGKKEREGGRRGKKRGEEGRRKKRRRGKGRGGGGGDKGRKKK